MTNWYLLVLFFSIMSIAYNFKAALLARLQSGEFLRDQKLPTERVLADSYGISRTTVRKVLSELKDEGLIAQTVGSGTYLTSNAQHNQSASESDVQLVSPAELMEARIALEPSIVELVVRNATWRDFEQMTVCCEKAEAAETLEEFEKWDGALHEVIAKAAHNQFVSVTFKLIQQVREHDDWGQLKKRSVTPQRRLAYQKEHRVLVDALRERDIDKAKVATLAHLQHVRRNLLGE